MAKVLTKIKSFLPTKRKLMQLYFALLYNANLKGFTEGRIYQGNSKSVCLPGLNCYSCPGAVGACPLGSLQGSISSGKSTFFYVGGILVLFGVLFGRMICGWACPFGLIQELLHKIKTPKLKKSPVTRILSYLKYVILAVFVFIIPLMYAFRDVPLPAFCKYICPAGTIEGGVSLLANEVNNGYFSMLGPIFTWKFCLLVGFVVASVFIFRFFCRFFCPLGALYGLFNHFSVFGIKLEKQKCVDCNLCTSHCKMDIRHVGDMECIGCGECVGVCPTKAISWKGSVFTLRPNEIGDSVDEEKENKETKNKRARLITRSVSAVVMVSVLAGALVYYNRDTDNGKNDGGSSLIIDNGSGPESDAPPVGNQVGNTCVGANLKEIDSNGETGETVNPAATGKITVINFWGTWCVPCVEELPYFEQIAEEYHGIVDVIAVHSALGVDTAPDYIKRYYPDSKLIFVKDEEVNYTGVYYSALGGTGTYPYTVILDENGVIAFIEYASVDYPTLKAYVEQLLE